MTPVVSIFLIIFIDLVGFGMMIPILPYYAQSYGASATTLGLLMMSYSAMQMVFSPFWGGLSDRWGRRPILLICIAGIGASMLLLWQAHDLKMLFAGRLLAGFFGANISTASAYMADVTPTDNRTQGMGMIGAAFGLGFLVGPPLGGTLSQWGYGTAALAVAILSLANWVLAFFILEEPALSTEARRTHRHHLTLKPLLGILKNPATGIIIFIFLLTTLGMAQMETTFAYFMLQQFGIQAKEASYVLALMALIMVVVQGGVIRRLAPRLAEPKLIITGCLLMAAGLIGVALSASLATVVFWFAVQSLGFSLLSPSLMGLNSKYAPKAMQGTAMGVYQSAGSLGRILGPIMGGMCFDRLGLRAPFLIASGFFLLGMLVTMVNQRLWLRKA